jgi:hypothetical protein
MISPPGTLTDEPSSSNTRRTRHRNVVQEQPPCLSHAVRTADGSVSILPQANDSVAHTTNAADLSATYNHKRLLSTDMM